MALSDYEYEKALGEDPGNSIFAEFADVLRSRYDYNRAFRVCLLGLSLNPTCAMGRLVLARLFYEQSFTPFAVRELIQLREQFSDSHSLSVLLSKLAPQEEFASSNGSQVAETSSNEGIVAEAEFDLDDIELIERDEE